MSNYFSSLLKNTVESIAAFLILLNFFTSCDSKFSDSMGDGSLQIHFPENLTLPTVPYVSLLSEEERKSSTPAESKLEVQLDTNDFILSVVNSSGASLYYGSFGAAPQKIITAAGTYTITAKSTEFYTPLFSTPQYGDTKLAVVSAGKECKVLLECKQLNCGIRLSIDPDFLTEFPQGVLFLKSAEGKLMYGYSEDRTAYFRPGAISLVLNNAGKESTLATYNLEAQQIMNVKLQVSASSGQTVSSGIHIRLDTTRVWLNDSISIGGGSGTDPDKGTEKEDALSVNQAKSLIGSTDVWVYGYIVGGDLTSSKCSFELPFSSRTNLVLAEKSSCQDKEECLSVQLSTGSVRDALNLVDNPGLLGKKVFLKGDIVESYYGIPGIQAISDFSF